MRTRTLATIVTFLVSAVLTLLVLLALGNIGRFELMLVVVVAGLTATTTWFAGRGSGASTSQQSDRRH